ncbi:MAG: tetratricopeptide repeat protein [Acidobacteriota bacterium]
MHRRWFLRTAAPAALFSQRTLGGRRQPGASQALRCYEKANALFVAKKFPECQQALDAAVRLDPNLLPAWTLMAKLAMGMNQYDLARSSLQRALAIDPASPYARFLSGFLYHLENDLQLALPELEKARQLNPRDARPVLYLALTRESLGQTAEASALYEEAIRLEEAAGKPTAEPLLAYSRLLFLLGRLNDCGKLVDRALRLEPDSRDAHYERARLLLTRGDAAAAAAEGEKALRLSGGITDRQVRYLLVRAYQMAGQDRSAAEQAAALRAAEAKQVR